MLEDTATANTLLDDLVEAQRLNALALQHPHLAAAVLALRIAVEAGGSEVVAASSREGERLLGALLLTAPSLRCWGPGDRAVTLIDGYVAGLAGICDTALMMRRMGTLEVRCVVLGSTAPELARAEVDVVLASPQRLFAIAATDAAAFC